MKKPHYYNEFDPFAGKWLQKLIDSKLIPHGHVDTRSIDDVSPADLAGYTQCHFFTGIGGWPLALQLAGWPSDRPVWTGSCPCQPFSSAGKGKGEKDPRHLWPSFSRLIAKFRPPTVFGEQVASAIGHGWLDGVCADLEAQDYACGAVVLGAHSVGAPHMRQRLWWVAKAAHKRPHRGQNTTESTRRDGAEIGCETCASGMGDALNTRLEGQCGHVGDRQESGRQQANQTRPTPAPSSNRWGNTWTPCADGKARRVEPSIPLLAHGIPNRVGRLRGYGNAIVPQTAQVFIEAFLAGEAA